MKNYKMVLKALQPRMLVRFLKGIISLIGGMVYFSGNAHLRWVRDSAT